MALAYPSNPHRKPRIPSSDVLSWLAFVLLALAIVSLHSAHFAGRAYREDEAWHLHSAILRTVQEDVRWIAVNIHPPLYQLFLDLWVEVAGQHERAARFSSTLWTCLALAFTYRLAADLFNRRVALLAVFLLGTLAVYQFYGHELRPYAMLVAGVTAAQLAFLRWIRHPNFGSALFFVAASVLTWYSHFFAVFMIAALLIYFVIFVRWNRGLYLRAFGLFALIGLSFSAWILPFLHAVLVVFPGGVEHTIRSGGAAALGSVYSAMQLRPAALGEFLLIAGVLLPAASQRRSNAILRAGKLFRFPAEWSKGYIIVVPLLIVLIALVTNRYVASITVRNLMIVLPSAAILAAFALNSLPRQARAAILLLVAVPALTTFVIFSVTGPFYTFVQVLNRDEPGQRYFVVITPARSSNILANYYLRERLATPIPNARIFHLMPPMRPQEIPLLPDIPTRMAMDASPQSLRAFQTFLNQADRLSLILQQDGAPFMQPFLDLLDQEFEPFQTTALGEAGDFFYFVITDYRRIPDHPD